MAHSLVSRGQQQHQHAEAIHGYTSPPSKVFIKELAANAQSISSLQTFSILSFAMACYKIIQNLYGQMFSRGLQKLIISNSLMSQKSRYGHVSKFCDDLLYVIPETSMFRAFGGDSLIIFTTFWGTSVFLVRHAGMLNINMSKFFMQG